MNPKLAAALQGKPMPQTYGETRDKLAAQVGYSTFNPDNKLLNNTECGQRPLQISDRWGDYADYVTGLSLFGKTGKFVAQNLPKWARFRLQIRFCEWTDPKTGKHFKPGDKDGSSWYPSFDWRPLNAKDPYKAKNGVCAYDEHFGLKLLLKFMCEMDIKRYSIATIYGVIPRKGEPWTLQTQGARNYNQTICTFTSGEIKAFPVLEYDWFYNNKGNKARRLQIEKTRKWIDMGMKNMGMVDEINRTIRVHNAHYYVNEVHPVLDNTNYELQRKLMQHESKNSTGLCNNL